MADRTRFYFQQLVEDTELNLAFDQLEAADRVIISDFGWSGFLTGGLAAERVPTVLGLRVAGPTVGYDSQGRRVASAANIDVDLTLSENGIPTAVSGPGKERWVSVFLRFKRVESDPRPDGNAQQVYWLQEEGFEVVVRQGAEANTGLAVRPSLVAGELLVCDVLRSHGQSSISNAAIDSTRRVSLRVTSAELVSFGLSNWSGSWIATGAGSTVQSAVDRLHSVLYTHVPAAPGPSNNFKQHEDTHIYVPSTGRGWIGTVMAGADLGAALLAIVNGLAAQTGNLGSSRIGNGALASISSLVPAGTLEAQLNALGTLLFNHFQGTAQKHDAASITRTLYSWLTSTNVDAALNEIVDDLANQVLATAGASRIGMDGFTSGDITLSAGTVQAAIKALADRINFGYMHPISMRDWGPDSAPSAWTTVNTFGIDNYIECQPVSANSKIIRIPIRVPVGKTLKRIEVDVVNAGTASLPPSNVRIRAGYCSRVIGQPNAGFSSSYHSGTISTLTEYLDGYKISVPVDLVQGAKSMFAVQIEGEPNNTYGTTYNQVMAVTAFIY